MSHTGVVGVMMDWFHELTGFDEQDYASTQARLELRDGRLRSARCPGGYAVGTLEMPSLAELRQRAAPLRERLAGRPRVRVLQADVRQLLGDTRCAGALFQVASQFNLLEMPGPEATPEVGVAGYAFDATQGPACAMAAGAATIYRNYLVPLPGGAGQTARRQIDTLADLGRALGNEDERLWQMRNGYALGTATGLQSIGVRLRACVPEALDRLRGLLRIGVQWNVEVTRGARTGHLVTQAFCSALPVAYTRVPAAHWAPFARLVLEGAYEATLWTGLLNAVAGGQPAVYLTLVGGGVFGNDPAWIADVLRRAVSRLQGCALDIVVVNNRDVPAAIRALVTPA